MPFSALISACLLDMNLSFSTIVHLGSVPIVVFGDSVNSSPRCGPCSGTIQPSSCIWPGPPCASITNACVFIACAFAGACCTCTAICAQYGHASQLLSSCWPHWLQNFFAHSQKPLLTTGGFGFGPCGAPGG